MSNYEKSDGDLVVFRNSRKSHAGDPDRTGFFHFKGRDHPVSVNFNLASQDNAKAPTHTGTIDINAKTADIAVFNNKDWEEGGTRPSLKTKVTIVDQVYWGGIWEHTSKKGVEYWSGRTSMDRPSQVKSNYKKSTQEKVKEDFKLDADLPF